MLIPMGQRYSQTLYLLRKKDGQLQSQALLPTLFVPMTGKAEAEREVKPDPANPQLVNGSFEEPAFPGGGQPGWYYERQVTWKTDDQAPDGQHYVEFVNTEPNLGAHLLQGFALDGRQVPFLEVSGYVKTENVVPGEQADQAPYIAVTLYDEQRRELTVLTIGPFRGTSAWRHERRTFRVPPQTREAIFRIGLFGATGKAAFDKLEVKKAARP